MRWAFIAQAFTEKSKEERYAKESQEEKRKENTQHARLRGVPLRSFVTQDKGHIIEATKSKTGLKTKSFSSSMSIGAPNKSLIDSNLSMGSP
jgi:hypothetical protein